MIVVAHRGASAYAPENTLAALEAAPRLGAHMAEIDVRRTADDELVVVHDPTLVRTTDAALRFPDRRPWRVQDFTLAEIRALDAGGWFDGRFAGQRVPTLREALEVLRESGCGALVELKVRRRDPLLGARVLQFFAHDPYWRSARRDGTLMVQSFDWVVLRTLTEALPGLCAAALGRPYGRIGLRRLARYARQVHPHHLRVTAPYVRQVHDQGLGMFGWTVNHPGAIRRLVRDGVDGIITDYPDRVSGQSLLAA